MLVQNIVNIFIEISIISTIMILIVIVIKSLFASKLNIKLI